MLTLIRNRLHVQCRTLVRPGSVAFSHRHRARRAWSDGHRLNRVEQGAVRYHLADRAVTRSGTTFTGTVRTLSNNANTTIKPADKASDKAPDYRTFQGSVEFGGRLEEDLRRGP